MLLSLIFCNPLICPPSSIGNGICDLNCMSAGCEYDMNDCLSTCIELGCSVDMLTNSVCDEPCNIAPCGFDRSECLFSSGDCSLNNLLNNSCDPSCNTEACLFDMSSCKDCSEECSQDLLTNSICDQECNVPSCDYDLGFCVPRKLVQCPEGYLGNECDICAVEFANTRITVCEECPTSSEFLILLIGTLLMLVLILTIVVKLALITVYRSSSVSSIYVKILLNYFQTLILISLIDLDWPDSVLIMFKVPHTSFGAMDSLYSMDCFMEDGSAVYSNKMLLSSILPVILLLVVTIYWLLASFYHQSTKYLRRELVVSIIVSVFCVYPLIIKLMLISMNCNDRNEDSLLVLDKMEVSCWDSDHEFIAVSVLIPSLVIWGLLLPLFSLAIVHKNRRNLHSMGTKKKYGFLFYGYLRKKYFWEYIIFSRKVALLIFTLVLDKQIQGLTSFAMLFVMFNATKHFKPYLDKTMNLLELRSLLVCQITLFVGLYFSSGKLNTTVESLMICLVLLANTCYVLNWTYNLFRVDTKYWNSRVAHERHLVNDQTPYVDASGEDKIYKLISRRDTAQNRFVLNPKVSMWDLYLNILHNETNVQYLPRNTRISRPQAKESSSEEEDNTSGLKNLPRNTKISRLQAKESSSEKEDNTSGLKYLPRNTKISRPQAKESSSEEDNSSDLIEPELSDASCTL